MNIFYNLNKNILLFLSRHTIFIILVIASFSNLNAQVETDINESSENRPYSRKLEVDSIRKSRVKYLRFSLTVKKGRIGLEKAKIQFYKKGEATAMINTMAKGKSTFKLNVNSEYIIKISLIFSTQALRRPSEKQIYLLIMLVVPPVGVNLIRPLMKTGQTH